MQINKDGISDMKKQAAITGYLIKRANKSVSCILMNYVPVHLQIYAHKSIKPLSMLSDSNCLSQAGVAYQTGTENSL